MKAFYLAAAIFFSVLLLVVAFGNFSAVCSNMNFLFWPVRENPTIVTLGIAVLGVITGFFYSAFLRKVFETTDEEEENF
jgi:uncharacterized integral membrane protein